MCSQYRKYSANAMSIVEVLQMCMQHALSLVVCSQLVFVLQSVVVLNLKEKTTLINSSMQADAFQVSSPLSLSSSHHCSQLALSQQTSLMWHSSRRYHEAIL